MDSPDSKEKANFTLSVQPVEKEDSIANGEDQEVFASGVSKERSSSPHMNILNIPRPA
jgi:hypothetical protein